MIMKKVGIVLLAGFFTLSLSLAAQNQRGQQRQGGMMSNYTPEKQAEQMAKDLNLTAGQQAKLADFYRGQKEQRDAKREEFMKAQNERREANQANREKFRTEREKEQKLHDAEIEKIIGKDKMEQLKKMREERRNKNRDARPQGRRMNRR